MSKSLDHPLLGDLDACGDTLMQRFKTVELAGKAGGAVASRMEQIVQPSVAAVSSEERGGALALEGGEKKLQELANGRGKRCP